MGHIDLSHLRSTHSVVYAFSGFLQPINDTAHQVGVATSIFNGGSTVPVKFEIRRADGTAVSPVSTPQWLTPVKGSPLSAAVDESAYAAPATVGDIYRVAGSQYIYNWSTKGLPTGFYYRIARGSARVGRLNSVERRRSGG